MMWPFKRKPEKPTEPVKSQAEIDSEALRKWRDVGESFHYLGREMVVTGHGGFDIAGGWPMPSISWRCFLSANYVDGNGVIRSHQFGRKEAMSLMNASKREAAA